jgi:hypothetical protein
VETDRWPKRNVHNSIASGNRSRGRSEKQLKEGILKAVSGTGLEQDDTKAGRSGV